MKREPLRTALSCPACGSPSVLRVALQIAGAPSTFTMCSLCEWKGWEREGRDLPLGSVLALVATQ